MRKFGTLKPSSPMSNTQRQRLFRERNPGYYGRLHRKRKAEAEALGAAQRAMTPTTSPHASHTPATPHIPDAPRPQLLLPAAVPPSEQLTFFNISQLQREREQVSINRTASDSIGQRVDV